MPTGRIYQRLYSAFVWQADRDGVLGTGAALAINTTDVSRPINNGNAGTGLTVALSWNATANAPWLALVQSNGNTPSDIELRARSANLAMGTYTTTVTVSASTGEVQSVPVSLQGLLTTILPETQSQIYLPLVKK